MSSPARKMETMKIGAVKTENGHVSCETPEGTVVHINIHQRSAFDCLLDTFRFFRDMKKSGKKENPSRMSGSAGHLGFGVAYISLGVVSVMLAILVCIVKPTLNLWYTGVHFWVGFPFIVSGILNLVAYKCPNKCWKVLAFVSLLVNFGVSIAGMVLMVGDIQRLPWFGPDEETCNRVRNRGGYYGGYYRQTTPPYYDDNDYYMRTCKEALQNYKTLVTGLVIMTLLMMIWGLCLSILSVGSRLKSFCFSCKLERTEEEDDALLKPNPSDDIIIA